MQCNNTATGAEVTQCSDEGFELHIRGYEFGVRIIMGKCAVDTGDDNKIHIELTGGTNHPRKVVKIGEFTPDFLTKKIHVAVFPAKQKGD
jgi:hypothetical protein